MVKILILGHGAHGKDTIADAVTRFTGLRFESSSMAAAEAAVFPELSKLYGYKTAQECFDDRRNHRQEWRALITAYNTPDKGRLCKEIIARCDGYIGMRCHEEFAAVRHLFDYVLWVDASLRAGPDPSMTIECEDDSMVYICNNGTPEDAWHHVSEWAAREGLCSRR